MFDPQMELLITVLSPLVAPAGGAEPPSWAQAKAAVAACEDVEDELALAVECEDADEVKALLEAYFSGEKHLPAHDRGVLKRALKAYRKRLKVTLLDDASSLGGGPFSGGKKSDIVGITPPHRYPPAVWKELVRQKRLVDSGLGMYELPPGG